MSTRFTIVCETCEQAGPHIRRHHSGAFLMAADTPRFFPDHDENQASDDWGSFLIQHEYHTLRLRTGYNPRAEEAAEERRRQKEEANRPTHMLMPDGSLQPL